MRCLSGLSSSPLGASLLTSFDTSPCKKFGASGPCTASKARLGRVV